MYLSLHNAILILVEIGLNLVPLNISFLEPHVIVPVVDTYCTFL